MTFKISNDEIRRGALVALQGGILAAAETGRVEPISEHLKFVGKVG